MREEWVLVIEGFPSRLLCEESGEKIQGEVFEKVQFTCVRKEERKMVPDCVESTSEKFYERKLVGDTVGGFITIKLLKSLLEQSHWTNKCHKQILTTPELWAEIRACVLRQQGKGKSGERVEIFMYGEGVRFEVDEKWRGSVLADPLCPAGELWLVDYSFLPWTSGVLTDLM